MSAIKILHIDDNADDRMLMEEFLLLADPERFEYHGMADTWAAENFIKEHPCDVVIADFRLSGADRYSSGANFLVYLCDQGYPALKLLVTSMDRNALSMEVLNLIRQGSIRFLPKETMDPAVLREMIDEGLDRAPRSPVPVLPGRFVPPTLPFARFEEASQMLVTHIQHRYGFQLAMMTRVNGDVWQVLQVEDQGYGVQAGDLLRWGDSFCARMVSGEGPMVTANVGRVPAYVEAPVARELTINSYIGIPVCRGDGSLFGTLCAIHPEVKNDALEQDLSELLVCAQLLSTILEQEISVQDLERKREASEADSRADALTGLYNRRGWDLLLESEEQRCRRFGHPCSVLMVDLDGLKVVNDTEGHEAGDALLKRTGDTLRRTIRKEDVAARLGGDEFGILAVETREEFVTDLASRIRQAFAAAGVSGSIGWASRTEAGSLQEACRIADEAMYEDKKARKAGR